MQLPEFSNFDTDNFANNLSQLLENNLKAIDKLLDNTEGFTWDNLMAPLDDMEDELSKTFSVLSHLHAVVNSPKLRASYEACLPRLSAYESAISHNKKLYEAIKNIKKEGLDSTRLKIIKDDIRNFELAGVALENEDKKNFEELNLRLSELSNIFENNVLDATHSFSLYIEDESRLLGLPEHTKHHARALSLENDKPGYMFTLDAPTYIAVMTYAEDRKLREELYYAYVTRASETGPDNGKFDNTKVMDEILAKRTAQARLLGFNNYAELSLATKMARSHDEVMTFLNNLIEKAYPKGVNEVRELKDFVKEEYGIDELKPFDVGFYSEKLRQKRHKIDTESLRPYFPLPRVLDGLFEIIHILFGATFKRRQEIDVWHEDVMGFELQDITGKVIGFIYMDLFARPNKRGGAWMDSYQSRRRLKDATLQLPIAFLTCNFTKPLKDKPATLSHDEVITLFHEMGHCLHHLLTKIEYLSASGIHGVEWDAVELPSQFLENWAWEKEGVARISGHVETGEQLPDELFKRMLDAKNFHTCMAMLRQLEFSIFDFRIHSEYEQNFENQANEDNDAHEGRVKEDNFIAKTLEDVRKRTALFEVMEYNRFQHGFSHIFGGEYAAGYYSYKWAEVLSSDAFSRFEEEGVFNPETGQDFLTNILEVGSSKTAYEAFVAFRGRAPSVDALLKHNGVI